MIEYHCGHRDHLSCSSTRPELYFTDTVRDTCTFCSGFMGLLGL